MKSKACELCNGEASLYCVSDAAYLCWSCDAKVHEANFLVARHVRRTLCCRCKEFDGSHVSGVGFRRIRTVCRHCLPEDGDSCDDDDSSSSISCSSDCVSSTESLAATEKIRRGVRNGAGIRRIGQSEARAEGILVIWSRRLGLRSRCCVDLALRAFRVCMRKLFTDLPFRVCLASSLCLAANLCEPRGLSTWQLMRLEECSRVPKKLILLGESRISRAAKLKKSSSSREEGWAECSDG